ncbi:MAG: cupin domain-containing protein [Acidimicrobiia bacterium]
MSDAFDLSTTCVHLGLGARVDLLPDFEWTPEYLTAYRDRTEGDGDDGRLVGYFEQGVSWDSWERHPGGEELVVLVSGRVDLFQEIDGEVHKVELTPGTAVVNPRGVWHTADVHDPGHALFITPGRGTEVRPR